ncbi:hypothetical protein CBOM_01060 [Ceraceosorus bombacis]|uniref:Uncharacterized protein n=1 Tax=Ceraceosorus bombacis TaxID=401625 RepID=A0A0P1BCQ5_9BASI|nr:hypothetical protein CBOM_01060 [Ceraceosorus bombacis]
MLQVERKVHPPSTYAETHAVSIRDDPPADMTTPSNWDLTSMKERLARIKVHMSTVSLLKRAEEHGKKISKVENKVQHLQHSTATANLLSLTKQIERLKLAAQAHTVTVNVLIAALAINMAILLALVMRAP